MNPMCRIALIVGSIGFMPLAGYPQALQVQSYSIDQTRYFAAPEIESAKLKPLLREVGAFPASAPKDAKALAEYLARAEDLLAQLQRHAELLRKGFYAPPKDLLRTFFGRDLSQRELVDDGMDTLKRRLDALAEAYKKIDAKR